MKKKLSLCLAVVCLAGCTITKVPGLMNRYNFGTKQQVGEVTFTVSTNGITNIVLKSYNNDMSAELGIIASKVAEGVVNGMKQSGS
jgi:hypothetical protein